MNRGTSDDAHRRQPRLETARCILRPAERGDIDALVAAIRSPLFPRELPLARMQTREDLARWLENLCSRSVRGEAFLWSIDLKEGPRCAGQVSLSPLPGSNAWSLAFWLDPAHWGHGLAIETVSAVTRSAFESLAISELWAGAALWNHRSMATLERLGFQFLADNPAGYLVSGAPEPVREFRMTRQHWQGPP